MNLWITQWTLGLYGFVYFLLPPFPHLPLAVALPGKSNSDDGRIKKLGIRQMPRPLKGA